ncbi:YlxR family protein [Prochlorococcus marinus]|uniref:YlxR family protein n=1 Tax=Prochlorococcus marinus TaxID=1219 RepID=UPI001FD69C81|nr:YlxR family protein [Prochlorococcus marinus]
MIQKKPVLRICISCRKSYDRKNLIKITKDHKKGIMFHEGMGRSAYICKSKKCYSDSKIKKKLQKALKTFLEPEFVDILKKKLQATISIPIREYN